MKRSAGAVAAGHALTARAAEEMLRAGGNAFDAATAAFFTACVAEPVLASLGGGGFLLASPVNAAPRVYDFFTHTPLTRRATPELDFEKVVVDFGSAQQIFYMGHGTTAAPGAVAGILQAHAEHGRMPLAEVAAPSVTFAREGITVTPMQATVFGFVEPIYISRPSARALFESPSTPGRALRAGDVVRFAQLADVIETLCAEGRDFFYRGEIAAAVHRHLADHGHLTRDDLARYEVKLRQPLARRYHDAAILTNPPPAAGGTLAACGIALAERCTATATAFGDTAAVLTMAAILRATSESRINAIAAGDGDIAASYVLNDAALSRHAAAITGALARTGTTHISVVDAAGNAAALTVSNGAGCGEVLPGTGIMMNNMLGEEDLNPRGLHRWRSDERMSSMMAPTIIRRRDGATTVTGSGGSNRIRSALVQVAVNLVHHAIDIERAVTAPRLHHDDVLYVEGGFGDAAIAALSEAWPDAIVFPDANFFFGGAHSVHRDAAGNLSGCGDPRRDGKFSLA